MVLQQMQMEIIDLTFLQNPFENKSLILKVSYIGYQSFTDTLTFDDIDQDFSKINYSLSADVMET